MSAARLVAAGGTVVSEHRLHPNVCSWRRVDARALPSQAKSGARLGAWPSGRTLTTPVLAIPI